MQALHNVYVDKCVQYWYNTKNCRIQQKKEKQKDYILILATFFSSSGSNISTSESELTDIL